MTPGDPIVSVRDLTFRYGRSVGLSNVDAVFDVGVTALLGPNGAGKSTLLGCVATELIPPAGTVFVHGWDASDKPGRQQIRQHIGFLPQQFDLVPSLRLVDTVAYAAWACGVDERQCYHAAEEALAIVDLSDRARAKVRTLSGGQRQRVGIAASIAHNPSILLLDEPTVGLDPESTLRMREHIARIGLDRTVVMATHIIEDVSRLVPRILVLDGGRVVFSGSSEELAALSGGRNGPLVSPLEYAYHTLLGVE